VLGGVFFVCFCFLACFVAGFLGAGVCWHVVSLLLFASSLYVVRPCLALLEPCLCGFLINLFASKKKSIYTIQTNKLINYL
jgi:apolipoprotein N-acyltransferase